MKTGKKHKKNRRNPKFWALLGISLVVIALLVFLSLWVIYLVEQWFNKFLAERIFEDLERAKIDNDLNGFRLDEIRAPSFPEILLPPIFIRQSAGELSREILIGRSFADSFSGFGWIDREKTNLFHNFSSTGFTYPPIYRWDKIPSGSVGNFLSRDSDGSISFCIKESCLAEKENRLFLDGKEIFLPSEKRPISVSLGKVGDKWLVGEVLESKKNYEGRVYFFDGKSFEEVLGTEHFQTPYKGTFGFGGVEDDWVAFYGALRGTAVQVLDGKPSDISRFFSYRVMRKGFQPVVERVSLGDETVWYIWSLTEKMPILFKLLVDEIGAIKGIFDFTDFILSGFNDVVFKPFDGGLFAKINGGESLFRFNDLGFEKFGEGRITSSNINTIPGEVINATVASADLLGRGFDFQILLSNDGKEWIKTEIGETVVFPNKQGRFLFWQVVTFPESGPRNPFFMGSISINFRQKSL